MLVVMAAVMPAAATSASSGQGYTWTTIDVPGSYTTVPITINDHGVVVGKYYANSSDWKNGVSRGFIKQGRKYTTIDDPLGAKSVVMGMNDHGEIVGAYWLNNGDNYGFMDQGGKFTTIADPYADNAKGLGTIVVGVTSSGEIVGDYIDSNSTNHVFVYKNGSYTTITCPRAGTGPNSSTGDAGTIVGFVDSAGAMSGYCAFKTSGFYNFIYQNSRFNRVPNYPGSSSTWISWVTDSGESGGAYYTTPTAAENGPAYGYIYKNGQFTAIKDPLGPYGIYLDGANDSGAIVGFYGDSSNLIHGFELTPSH
jgi:hypothetical protein